MIKFIELFGGIGTQAMAMRALKKDFSSIGYVEWNDESVACYRALAKKSIEAGTEKALEMLIDDADKSSDKDIYNKSIKARSITDVTAADFPILHNGKDIFIMFSSFPCQSLSKESKSGRKGGGIDPTRRDKEPTAEELKSALVWDTIRIFKELHDADPESKVCLPHYIFMENVIGMIDAENRPATLQILRTLGDIGYDTELMVIDGNKIGEPQMRKRVFVVSKLRGVGLPEFHIPSVAMPVTDYDKTLGNIMRAPTMTPEECESLKKTLNSYIDYNPATIVPSSIYATFDKSDFINSIKKTLETENGKAIKDYRDGIDNAKEFRWQVTPYGQKYNNSVQPEVIDTSSRPVIMMAEKKTMLKKALNAIIDIKMVIPEFALFNADFSKTHSKTAFNKFRNAMLASSENAFDTFNKAPTEDEIKLMWAIQHPEDPNVEGVSRFYANGRVPTTLTKSKLLMIDTENCVIREPSAKELGRLQGFTDEDIDEMMSTLSEFFLQKVDDAEELDTKVFRSMNFKTGDSILVPALKELFKELPTECNENDDVGLLGKDHLDKVKANLNGYKNNLDDRRNDAYKSAAEGIKAINSEYGEWEIPINDLHAGYLSNRPHTVTPPKVKKAVKDKDGNVTEKRKTVRKGKWEDPNQGLLDFGPDTEDEVFDKIYNDANEARENDK